MEVIWKFESLYKADANEAYKEINKLEKITPQNVVDMARDEKSVIHEDFEWNDEIAGEKYRVIQAQEMIRSFIVVPKKKEHQPMRALQITTEKSVYKPLEFFVKNIDEYQNLLNRAKKELRSIKERYKDVTELKEVFEAIDEL